MTNPVLHPVFLVGAGPGDLELVTLKAARVLGFSEIIFYDNLVNPKLLALAAPAAERVYVGKRGEGSQTDQRLIEDQIVAAAKAGKKVVRLKGGDPFIFGRGGEEAERLSAEKIPFEIVPGVSSAIAAPAYAGIPLTHRNFTSTVAFVTGHGQKQNPSENLLANEGPNAAIDWNALAQIGTLVFLMSVKTAKKNMQHLIDAGRAPNTPAACIRWGTTPSQQTLVGTIATIASQIEKEKIMPPAVLVVGEVVSLREKLAWFESRPLFGKKIGVTRAASQNAELLEKLKNLGAEVFELPAIAVHPLKNNEEIDEAIHTLQEQDWCVFTSVHGVEFFLDRIFRLGFDARLFSKTKIACIGPKTAEAFKRFGLKADLIPNEFDSEGLIAEFEKQDLRDAKVLLVRASKGREELAEFLKKKAARFIVLPIYETRFLTFEEASKSTNTARKHSLDELLELDLITFTASSTVESVAHWFDSDSNKKKFLEIPCVCIGPVSAQTAKKIGFKSVSVATQATLQALVCEVLASILPKA